MAFWSSPTFKRAAAETALFPSTAWGQLTWLPFAAAGGAIPEAPSWHLRVGYSVAGALIGLAAAYALRFAANWIRAPYVFWATELTSRRDAERALEGAREKLLFEQNLRSQAIGSLNLECAAREKAEVEIGRLQRIERRHAILDLMAEAVRLRHVCLRVAADVKGTKQYAKSKNPEEQEFAKKLLAHASTAWLTVVPATRILEARALELLGEAEWEAFKGKTVVQDIELEGLEGWPAVREWAPYLEKISQQLMLALQAHDRRQATQ